ncbi:cytochrome P450 [Xylariaceae sp. FL1272]|nr:cytochrome P450 [Xylariaceae sp. FL1272]
MLLLSKQQHVSETMETLKQPVLLAPALLAVYLLYRIVFSRSKRPDLPIVGAKRGEWFPLMRAGFRNVRRMREAYENDYMKHHRDHAVIFPFFGGLDFVMLPAKELQWLVDQPESDISLHEQLTLQLQLPYTIPDERLYHNPHHVPLISNTLTREMYNLIPDLCEETQVAVSRFWGTDAESFQEVSVYDTMQKVIGQVTNRIFVGPPLCRDMDLLKACIDFSQSVSLSATLLKIFPSVVRPLVAPFILRKNRRAVKEAGTILKPEIVERLHRFDTREKASSNKSSDEPNDFLQWCIKQGKSTGEPWTWDPDTLVGRVLLLSLASIHTSTFTISSLLFDLLSGSPEDIEELRAEASMALAENGGVWSKKVLSATPKLESAFRESQRLNSFAAISTSRMVMNPQGVTTPSGVNVPYKTLVCTPSYSILHDERTYEEPWAYRPFRFVGTNEGQKAKAFATTTADWPAFGHGRNSCPGRFFASAELRLLMGYLLLNYDFEMIHARPENLWIGMARIPNPMESIKVRRRK